MVTGSNMNIKKIIHCFTILLVSSLLASGLYATEDDKTDINKVTVEELAKIPVLNRELAEKIIKIRNENGEFVDMDELLDIEGIDAELLLQIKKYLKIEAQDDCNC